MNLPAFFEGFFEKIAEYRKTKAWTSRRSAKTHARKHARGMNMSEDQYWASAAMMLHNRNNMKQVRDKKLNAYVYWNPKNNHKLVVSPRGKIISYYLVGTLT